MSFNEDLFSKLVGDPGVSAIVSRRVSPNVFTQQDSRPAIRYMNVTTTSYHLMGVDANIERQRWQIDLIAGTYNAVTDLRDAVKTCLNRWSSAGVVQDSYFVNATDIYDDETRMHRIKLDYDFIVEV